MTSGDRSFNYYNNNDHEKGETGVSGIKTQWNQNLIINDRMQ